jgi:transposase
LARKQFIELISTIENSKLVYCDEAGVSNNISVLYGWSEKGKRSYGEQRGFATERLSIVAGYTPDSKELLAPFEYSGHMNGGLFEQWVRCCLCPALKAGQYVIMDNVSFHKAPIIKELIEEIGCYLIYLPAYSPDLNSIEHCWANFKNYLRKIINKFDNLKDAITYALSKTLSG